MNDRNSNLELLRRDRQIGIGVYDGLSALVATKCSADFLWLGSFSIAAARGLPDAGLIGSEALQDVVRAVARCTPLPLVVDLDSSFGDPACTYHTARGLFLAGAAAVAVEDGPLTKRSSLYLDQPHSVVPLADQIARITAARSAARSAGRGSVIGRTEALVSGLGHDEAMRRAQAFVAAGASGVLVQSLDPTGSEALDFALAWARRSTLLLVPTMYPGVERSKLFDAGASHVIYANQALRAAHGALERACAHLLGADATKGTEMSSVADVSDAVGASQLPMAGYGPPDVGPSATGSANDADHDHEV
jgi:phosphoenolpyruvate phosphomutase